jgi:hypothetical protein
VEEFKRLLEAFVEEARDSYHRVKFCETDSYKSLLRYFEERTRRPLDWVRLFQDEFRHKIFEAGRGLWNWRLDLTDLSDEECTKKLREIHPALFCKNGFLHVPPEAVLPAVIRVPPPSFRGGLPIGERQPFRCPICNGTGFHDGPVVAGSSSECRACKGACIVWG